ncbi:MAG TPA: HigA family addiction module antitoxin [Nocardioidaceae bacterium]|nr:HigA family addiction module antitoxin [Nocardioidaceae bacterium]
MMRNPIHPGEIIREDVVAELGLSVSEAAARLGVSRVALSSVLHGHARISPNLAARLEEAGIGTARAWLAMQVPMTLPPNALPAFPSCAGSMPPRAPSLLL